MRLLASQPGLFGQISVMERRGDGARLYCIGASVQTMVRPDGVSVFGYVHATKLLLRDTQTVLLVGGAGGSLATMLARQGKAVTVIDVDPAAETIARQYFSLDARVRWITGNPLHLIQSHDGVFDGVVIDACDGEGLVAPFSDPDTIAEVLTRLCPDGSLVINLVHKDGAPPWGVRLTRALAARGLAATLYRSEDGWEGNEVLHVRACGATDTLVAHDLNLRPAETRTYLMSLRAFTPPHAAPAPPPPDTRARTQHP